MGTFILTLSVLLANLARAENHEAAAPKERPAVESQAEIDQLILDLDSDYFAERESATHRLSLLLPISELEKAVANSRSPEQKYRAQTILDSVTPQRLSILRERQTVRKLRDTAHFSELCEMLARIQSQLTQKKRDRLAAIEYELDQLGKPVDEAAEKTQSDLVSALLNERQSIYLSALDRLGVKSRTSWGMVSHSGGTQLTDFSLDGKKYQMSFDTRVHETSFPVLVFRLKMDLYVPMNHHVYLKQLDGDGYPKVPVTSLPDKDVRVGAAAHFQDEYCRLMAAITPKGKPVNESYTSHPFHLAKRLATAPSSVEETKAQEADIDWVNDRFSALASKPMPARPARIPDPKPAASVARGFFRAFGLVSKPPVDE